MTDVERTVVSTASAPSAIGPYSQAIQAGGFVFTSGQIPLDPETMKVVGGGIEAQTEQVLKNLTAVLEVSGSSLELTVKTTCYLKDLDHFTAFNAVYARFLGIAAPARSTVQVAKLPMDVLVEVDCVALIGPGGTG